MRKDQKERDGFPYIHETIIREHRREQVRSLLRLVGSAVLFGCVAGVCILMIQRLRPRETPMLADDVRSLNETPGSGQAGDEPSGSGQTGDEPSGQETAVQPVSALAGYEKVKDAFLLISTVYGGGDWLDVGPSVVGTTETFGLVVAEDSEKYYILTAADRIEAAEEIYAEIGGRSVAAEEEQMDRIENIGLISVWKEDLPEETACGIAVLGETASLQAGDTVIAAGSPYSYAGSVNYGHVVYQYEMSAYDSEQKMICTDMNEDPGGQGVLLNTEGEVVAWILSSGTGSGNGLIRAAAIEDIRAMIKRMVEGESLAYLGVKGSQVTKEIAQAQGIPEGLYLTMVAEDSPAKDAGMQPGDIVLSLNGQTLEDSDQLWDFLLMKESGDSVTVALKRMVQESYEEMEIEVTLGER